MAKDNPYKLILPDVDDWSPGPARLSPLYLMTSLLNIRNILEHAVDAADNLDVELEVTKEPDSKMTRAFNLAHTELLESLAGFRDAIEELSKERYGKK